MEIRKPRKQRNDEKSGDVITMGMIEWKNKLIIREKREQKYEKEVERKTDNNNVIESDAVARIKE